MMDEELLLDIVEYTNQAMLYELFTYPSFGKVSPYSNGSHSDMDAYTFIDSISVLNKYMYQFAKLGYSKKPIEELYNEAVQIGKTCENEMLLKTNGINTHKGLIFVLGTLVCSAMKALYDKSGFHQIFTYVSRLVGPKLKDFNDLKEKEELSHGEKIYLDYKVKGVREEAYLGFPIIQDALKILNIKKKTSHVKTFVYIMSRCDDTTILHRSGLAGLKKVKKIMQELLEEGLNQKKLEDIQEGFIQDKINPGGSADLLCGTFFLLLVKNKFIGVDSNEW